jgi:hypothetical protein
MPTIDRKSQNGEVAWAELLRRAIQRVVKSTRPIPMLGTIHDILKSGNNTSSM